MFSSGGWRPFGGDGLSVPHQNEEAEIIAVRSLKLAQKSTLAETLTYLSQFVGQKFTLKY